MDVLASGYPSLDYIISVSHSPGVGDTALVTLPPPDVAPTIGGCGANVAVGLCRLGFRAGVGMVIGDDQRGRAYQDYLESQGVDLSHLIVLPGTKTSCSFLFRNPQGEYQNFFFAGAADAWQGKLRLDNLPQVGYGLITVAPYHYNRQFLEQLAVANIPIIWQLKPDIYAYPPEGVQLFARCSRYILMNHLEAGSILNSLGLKQVSDLLKDMTQAIVVTRGSAGVTLVDPTGEWSVPSIPAQVEDTTGAGDGFTAGFLAGILRGLDLLTSAKIGVVVASFVLEKIGCQTNLPTWETMQMRYKEFFG
jgi:adenosine kinase